MEQQFKKLLNMNSAQESQVDPLFKTFEGALFADSAWILASANIRVDIHVESLVTAKVEMVDKNPEHLSEVLFIGDNFKGEGEDLLGRMILAMKLIPSEFYRHPFDESLDAITEVDQNLLNPTSATVNIIDVIANKRPKVVVSLGATITNILLGKKEKLSTIHGQFFERKANDWNYVVMPVFHPDLLLINPNMKRTAWIDLQKVMERIGKI